MSDLLRAYRTLSPSELAAMTSTQEGSSWEVVGPD